MQLMQKAVNAAASQPLPQLTYCTKIHAGETWPQIMKSLTDCVPPIKSNLGAQNLGICLCLGHAAIQALNNVPTRSELQEFLADQYNVFTINAFPYGPFHGEPVKQNVYAPDWSTPERLSYTNEVAELLAKLIQGNPESDNFGSISTVPGSFKPWVAGREQQIRSHLVQCVAKLVDLKRQTGVEIALALEPEPYCMLETIEETIDWFREYGHCAESCRELATLCGVTHSAAEELLRTHLGVCYDVCHAAVEFENARDSFTALQAAGIRIPKIQLSSALRVSSMDRDVAKKLSAFSETVYLHQVIQQEQSGALSRFLDLPEALQELEKNGKGEGAEWRVHFHVPVFLDRLEHFDTTQFFLRDVLKFLREKNLSPHLEVETYTWDVLPPELRNTDISTAIAREMQWVLDELDCKPVAS